MGYTRDSRGAALGGVPLCSLFDDPTTWGAPPDLATPAYVYDLDAMIAAVEALRSGFGGAPHLIAYAVKAASAGPIVSALVGAGCGIEAVSAGEIHLARKCGAPADRILLSGVGKAARDMDAAIGAGDRGVLALQIESIEEIPRIEARAAALGRTARVTIRINPSVEADTHAHIATGHDEAKFGVPFDEIETAFRGLDAAPHVKLVGLSCHVGSQLTRTDDYLAGARVVLRIAEERRATGAALEVIDFGGGFGIDYGTGCEARPADFAAAGAALVRGSSLAGTTLVVEPGRSLVGSHGVLCATVLQAKHTKNAGRSWLFIDAGMNDLVRPALYGARHRIEPMGATTGAMPRAFRVAGPVCESSDDFGEHAFCEVPARVIVRDAGAYGAAMASTYNGRPLATEVFLSKGRVASAHLAEGPETWAESRARQNLRWNAAGALGYDGEP